MDTNGKKRQISTLLANYNKRIGEYDFSLR